MKPILNPKYVKVIWIDSHHSANWELTEEIEGYYDMEIISVGILLDKTKRGVLLALSASSDGTLTDSRMRIPKCSIKSIITLTE